MSRTSPNQQLRMIHSDVPRAPWSLPTWAWVAIGAGVALVIGPFVLNVLFVWVPKLLLESGFAPRRKAMVDVLTIESAVQEFAIANDGEYPESLQELVMPDVDGHRYLVSTEVPKDPWGNEYRYDPPGLLTRTFRVYSLGRDGQLGGNGDDADMENDGPIRAR